MSVQKFKEAFEREGLPKALAAKCAALVFQTIETELALNGSFLLKGIGRLEVVTNRLGNPQTPIGGHAAEAIPVRVRLKVAKSIKAKIAATYRRPG